MSSQALQKKIFFAPAWVKKIINRQGLSLAVLQDLNSLSEILSSEDLACIALLNSDSQEYFGFNTAGQDAAFLTWNNGPDAQVYYDRIEPLKVVFAPVLRQRLFTPEELDDRYPNPYEIVDADHDFVVIFINPGHFAGTNLKASQSALIRELTKLIYVYDGFDRMARRGLFETYIQSLA